MERAKERPEERFTSLAHLIDVPALTRVYQRIRKDAAVGVDGITKEAYGQELEDNLRNLHVRLKTTIAPFISAGAGAVRHHQDESSDSQRGLGATSVGVAFQVSAARS